VKGKFETKRTGSRANLSVLNITEVCALRYDHWVFEQTGVLATLLALNSAGWPFFWEDKRRWSLLCYHDEARLCNGGACILVLALDESPFWTGRRPSCRESKASQTVRKRRQAIGFLGCQLRDWERKKNRNHANVAALVSRITTVHSSRE